MSLTKWKTKDLLPSLWDDEFLEDIRPFNSLSRFLKHNFSAMSLDVGATDIYEKNGNIVTETNLAGFEPKNIDVEVEDGCVKISANYEDSKEVQEDKKGRKYHRQERIQQSLHRTIQLPGVIKEKAAKAEFRDGILIVTVPKDDTHKERVKIEVKNN